MTRRMPALVALLFSSVSFAAEPSTAKTTLVIKGMTCGGCVAAVKVQLKKTPGVTAYDVSLEKGEAQVTYDPARTDPKKIAESVSKSGFEATVKGEKKAEAMHQLRAESGADQAWCLKPNRLTREVLRLIEKKGRG